jgi:hypothetical protein
MGESVSNRKQFFGISRGSRGLPGEYERIGSCREGQKSHGRRNKHLFEEIAVTGVESRQNLFSQDGAGKFD